MPKMQMLSGSMATVMSIAMLVAACSPGGGGGTDFTPVESMSSGVAVDLPGDGVADFEQLEVCKVWSDGTTGVSTDLDVTVADPGQAGATATHSLAADQCRLVAEFDGTTQSAGPADLMVAEQVPAGAVLDSIEVVSLSRPSSSTTTILTGVTSWSFANADDQNGFLVTFYNSMISGGGEGCTPGYWKQTHHFDSWVGYAPGDSYDTVFGVTSSFGGTLLDALKRGGGKENALGRHAVAALLNATSSVDYDLTKAQVIQAVQDAYASDDFNGVKGDLEELNEQGCPLK